MSPDKESQGNQIKINIPSTVGLTKRILINLFATILATFILEFAGLLSDGSATYSQLGVIGIILFTVITVATSTTTFNHNDMRFILVMALIIAGVTLVQWIYSFEKIASQPLSIAAAQLPIVVMIISFSYIVVHWAD